MLGYHRFFGAVSLVALALNASACGQVIEADYCVGVSTDETGAIGPDDNAFIVETIDNALMPLGYEKTDSPAIVVYKKRSSGKSVSDISRNFGPFGTVIAHYPGSGDPPYVEARAAIIAAVDNEIRPIYLVRDCEEISPGSTPKLYD